MNGRSQKRDIDLANAPEIANECISNIAEQIKIRDHSKVIDAGLQNRGIAFPDQEQHTGRRYEEHYNRQKCSEQCEKEESVMKAILDSFLIAGSLILCNQNGHSLRTAVTESIYNSLHAHGCCVGGNNASTKRIYSSLNEQLADIET